MTGSRRLSQLISEGDGIAIIVRVRGAAAASEAERAGAKALAVDAVIEGIRRATTLPLLWTGETPPVDADAVTIRHDGEMEHTGLEHVVDVRDEEELEQALEELDPEILLLSARDPDDGDDPLELVLELLPDVPAGKLAIAHVEAASREDVLALERAGIDAVLVETGLVAELVGQHPPAV